MNLTPASFHELLAELIDENGLACRGVLSLCDVVFTDRVPTACVSLGRRSVLRVNLDFVNGNCETHEHVRALILHEFLHVLLGHTRQAGAVTLSMNFAADAIINSLIHRSLGEDYSSFFSNYYLGKKYDPHLGLLCPQRASYWSPGYHHRKELHDDLHRHIESGSATMEDVLDYSRQLRIEELSSALARGEKLLIGGHDDWEPGELPPELENALRRAKIELEGHDGPLTKGWKRTALGVPLSPEQIFQPWSRAVAALLRRLVVPDRTAQSRRITNRTARIPILHPADRRSALRSLWNPLVPDSDWNFEHRGPPHGTAVYLDVSGSMNAELLHLAPILKQHSQWLRRPFWAFSNEVKPARFEHGKLVTGTTGGTSLAAVTRHLEQTRPTRVLIITDGYVEKPLPDWAKTLAAHGAEFLISDNGTDKVLAPLGLPLHQLPPLPAAT